MANKPRTDETLSDARAVAHLHADPELPEEEERPYYDKAWLQQYPCTLPSVHPAEWWIHWITQRKELAGVQRVLDIGGGNGVVAAYHWHIENVTILDIEPGVGTVERAVKGDCETALAKYGPKSFDVVQFTEIIEHLRKLKGRRMLEMLPQLARKAILITTPGGFSRQPASLGNPYNVHVSGWTPMEFEAYGYHIHMNGSQIFAYMGPEDLR